MSTNGVLTLADLRSLEIGDVIEAEGLLIGLDKTEPVRMHVDEKMDADEAFSVKFIASYFGVYMGSWLVQLRGEALIWSKVS